MKLKLIKLTPLFVSLIILYLIFSKISINELNILILKSNKPILLFAFALFVVPTIALSHRWNIILTNLGYKIKYKTILSKYLASIPVSKYSISNSGDLMRAFLFKNKIKMSDNIEIIFLETLMDFLALGLLSFLASFCLYNILYLKISFFIIVLILFILFLIAKIKRIKIYKYIYKFKIIPDLIKIKTNIFLILKIFSLSLFSWLFIILFIKFTFLSIYVKIPFLTILTLQPIVILMGLLPITFSGVGIRESSMLFLYSGFALNKSILSVGLIHTFASIVFLPIISLPFLFKELKKLSKNS